MRSRPEGLVARGGIWGSAAAISSYFFGLPGREGSRFTGGSGSQIWAMVERPISPLKEEVLRAVVLK